MFVAMFRRIFSYKFFPLAFTIFTIILLCIPGSMVPGEGIFGLENLDKVVHVILFAMNVLFWGWHYQTSQDRSESKKNWNYLAAVAIMSLLGVVMEYVQLYFIPNRSFDSWDIVADIVGSVAAGVWLWRN